MLTPPLLSQALEPSFPALVPGGEVMTDQGLRRVWVAAPSGQASEPEKEKALTPSSSHSPFEGSSPSTVKKLIKVAVGVLLEPTGRFLMTTRPPGKVYEGYWEFPGGKFEALEDAAQALARELEEELGIEAQEIHPWRVECIDYPHGLVELHFCKVTRWRGEISMREGQSFSWQSLPVRVAPVLPGTLPVLQGLLEEGKQIINT